MIGPAVAPVAVLLTVIVAFLVLVLGVPKLQPPVAPELLHIAGVGALKATVPLSTAKLIEVEFPFTAVTTATA